MGAPSRRGGRAKNMNLYYLQSAAAVILTFGMVIFLHELGHFIVCRLLGVRVEPLPSAWVPLLGTKGDALLHLRAALGGLSSPPARTLPTEPASRTIFWSILNRRLLIVA